MIEKTHAHTDANAIVRENPLKPGDFTRFIGNAAGLFWRMRINEKKIEFLNQTILHGLAGKNDVAKLLQNLVWAQEIVAEEDFFRFKLFIISMRKGEEAEVIFRVQDKDKQRKQNVRSWWKIAGAPSSEDPAIYYGYIRDISQDVEFISNLLEKDLERQTMIESENLPVMLVDIETGTVISRNTFAYELFGYTYREFISINFQSLTPNEQKSHISEIFKTCSQEGNWEGNLPLLKKGNIPIHAFIKMKRLSLRGRNLLKISIQQLRDTENQATATPSLLNDRNKFQQTLLNAMEEKSEMEEILDTLLAYQYGRSLFDAVMYADVHVKKHKVIVYARGKEGEVFANLKPGTIFDFEGTISQTIWENRLDFLILGDTLESTKPIDWALFIPHGVRSYFVKPFLHGKQLRTLLLFCSTRPNWFSEKDMNIYELYYPAFLKGLKNWRKKK